MLDLLTGEVRRPGRMPRRNFMKVGFLGLGGLNLADFLRLKAMGATKQSHTAQTDDPAVILLWCNGGPSHLEMYDLKPKAPQEYRGPFSPIQSNVPGLDVCELLPLHAKIADKFTLIRSVAHKFGGHNDGIPVMMSGHPDWDESKHESVFPEMGAVTNRVFGSVRNGIPTTAVMGATHYGYVPTSATGYWSNAFRPPTVDLTGIRNAQPTIDARRMDDRKTLLGSLDRLRSSVDANGTMESIDGFNRQAFEILSGGRVQQAFDLAQETPETRGRYGDGWGQQALLARRLVEAGVTFVTVGVPGGKEVYNWDDHAVNGDLPTAMIERLPGYDMAVTALIEDIYQRNLDRKVLIIASGEFGRTPRMNQQNGSRDGQPNWGRDHWPNAMSILMAGGGKKHGQVIGATNSKGEHPIANEYSPMDFLATVYQHLGIDYGRTFLDQAGRPIYLSTGRPFAEL